MKRCIYDVDTDFFKNWNSKMACVLGLTSSDGSIYKNTLSWQLQIGDKELLFRVRGAMKSDYPIELSKKKNAARLRISNPLVVKSLEQFGLTPDKVRFPNIHDGLMRDFTRGFLDGDGWIIGGERKNGICIGFVSRDRKFLGELVKELDGNVFLTSNNLRTNKKITKSGKISAVYQIEWHGTNAFNIIKFLCDDLKSDDLYLERKYKCRLEAREFYAESRKGRKWRKVERRYGMLMENLLSMLLTEKKLNGVQIAEMLGISSAAVYRWLEKTRIKSPIKRELVFVKCAICGTRFRQRRGKKYCSLACAGRANRSGKMVGCTVCGEEVYRPSWWFKRNIHPICSLKCFGKWHSMRLETNVRRRCDETGQFLRNASNVSVGGNFNARGN